MATAETQVIRGMSHPDAGWAGKTAQGTTELVMPSRDVEKMLRAMDTKALTDMANFMDKMFFDKKLRSEVFIKSRESADTDARTAGTRIPTNILTFPSELSKWGEKIANFPDEGRSVVLKEEVKIQLPAILAKRKFSEETSPERSSPAEKLSEYATALEKFAKSSYRLGRLYQLEFNERWIEGVGQGSEIEKNKLALENSKLRKLLYGF